MKNGNIQALKNTVEIHKKAIAQVLGQAAEETVQKMWAAVRMVEAGNQIGGEELAEETVRESKWVIDNWDLIPAESKKALGVVSKRLMEAQQKAKPSPVDMLAEVLGMIESTGGVEFVVTGDNLNTCDCPACRLRRTIIASRSGSAVEMPPASAFVPSHKHN